MICGFGNGNSRHILKPVFWNNQLNRDVSVHPAMAAQPFERRHSLRILNESLYAHSKYLALRERAFTSSAGFASAALVQFLSKKAERDHRPIGRMIRVRGRLIHVVDRGTGPCVVLLHGNGSMVEDFAATGLIDRLAQTHRVLALTGQVLERANAKTAIGRRSAKQISWPKS